MQKEDKQTNTAYIYASEKERYDAQIRSLRAQIDHKEKEIEKLDKTKVKNDATKNEISGEVDSLEQLSKELEITVEKINESISSKKLQEEVIEKTKDQVERVENLRKEKTTVRTFHTSCIHR